MVFLNDKCTVELRKEPNWFVTRQLFSLRFFSTRATPLNSQPLFVAHSHVYPFSNLFVISRMCHRTNDRSSTRSRFLRPCNASFRRRVFDISCHFEFLPRSKKFFEFTREENKEVCHLKNDETRVLSRLSIDRKSEWLRTRHKAIERFDEAE